MEPIFHQKPRYGRPSFPDILKQLAELWRSDRNRLISNKEALRTALFDLSDSQSLPAAQTDNILQIAKAIGQEFDTIHGGIGGAPKFPQAPVLRFLWHAARFSNDSTLETRLLHTLRRICQGGIYDHLGGGFARYSVDAFWLVPHFEKMLYDNAQLLELLALAHARTDDQLFLSRIEQTIDWLQREMMTDGCLAAAIDADSEGEEGRYYVWTFNEIEDVFGERSDFFNLAMGVTARGNWEEKNVLNRLHEPGLLQPIEEKELFLLQQRLLEVRETRKRPERDDKILADWNGLAIHGIASAGYWTGRPKWISLAEELFDNVVKTLSLDGRLTHSYRDGRSLNIAYLDDYAQLMRAALTLYETTGKESYLKSIHRWRNQAKSDFAADNGGYFLHGPGSEELIVRTKNGHDGPTPSANGTLAIVLQRLGQLQGSEELLEEARSLIEHFSGDAQKKSIWTRNLVFGRSQSGIWQQRWLSLARISKKSRNLIVRSNLWLDSTLP